MKLEWESDATFGSLAVQFGIRMVSNFVIVSTLRLPLQSSSMRTVY